jgi:hypothetical protein
MIWFGNLYVENVMQEQKNNIVYFIETILSVNLIWILSSGGLL